MRLVSARILAFASIALAAALGLSLSAAPARAQPMGQKMSHLYVRGDVGGAFSTNSTFLDTDGTAPNASLGSTRINGDSDNSVLLQGGLGLQLNPLLRIDATVETIPFLKYRTTSSGNPEASMNFTTAVGMLNGYVELNKIFFGIFGATEPYIDAGVGLAYNDSDHMNVVTGGTSESLSSDQHTDLAWAVGAGIGFPITHDLKFDIAYRYLNLGQLETGNVKTVNGVGTSTTQSKADLNVHTVMIGLRYNFYDFNAY